jgi:hypothetical protein
MLVLMAILTVFPSGFLADEEQANKPNKQKTTHNFNELFMTIHYKIKKGKGNDFLVHCTTKMQKNG